eukprot:jgi/Botrbrau1/4833/Bobra.0325s0045.1
MSAATAGTVKARLKLRGGVVHEIDIRPTGRISDSIAALKTNVGDLLSKYLATNEMDAGEVDVMEEVLSSDEEDDGSKKKEDAKRGTKRKAND